MYSRLSECRKFLNHIPKRSGYSSGSRAWQVAGLFLSTLILLLPLSICGSDAVKEEKVKKGKAPYRVVFSNDTTNIVSCVSPYHKKGEPFREDLLQATVDETAGTGVEVHMLQPHVGWIPWWKSKVYPIEEHFEWLREKTGAGPDSYGEYLLAGGDMVQVFVERCRQRGLTPFISLRLNDGHHVIRNGIASRFYNGHPEYQIGPQPKLPERGYKKIYEGLLNWAIPEVRAHKFAFIREICENYDIDGFELDFMRHLAYFHSEETTSEQRARIMTEFVAEVREVLDRTASPGQHRWLSIRVPGYPVMHDPLGIDLAAMVEAGVDMVNLSSHYYTEQQTDLPAIRKMVPDAAVYLEMTHCTATISRNFRATTDEQFYTTAHLAYARGADGVSAFNFVYFRKHGVNRGPFTEPPFRVFNHLGDPSWLARQPQHYFIAKGWHSCYLPSRPIPKGVVAGQSAAFTMDMAPPEGGWKTDGKLRIQGGQSLGSSQWTARFNKASLEPASDVSEPYPSPYEPALGRPEQIRAWTVPVALLKDGVNSIEITMVEGDAAQILYLDLAVK